MQNDKNWAQSYGVRFEEGKHMVENTNLVNDMKQEDKRGFQSSTQRAEVEKESTW